MARAMNAPRDLNRVSGNRRTEKLSDSLADLMSGGISLSAIVRGFPMFGRILLSVLGHRRTFIQERPSEPKIMLKDSLLFFLYAIFVSFLLVVPTMIISGFTIGKWSFLIRTLVVYSYMGVLSHIFCKLSRGQGGLRETVACYFYGGGVWVPMYVVCAYPLLLIVGPEIMFGAAEDLVMVFLVSASTIQTIAVIIGFVMFTIFSLIVSYFWYWWLSYVHSVSAKRLFGVSCLVLLPGGALYEFLLAPVINRVADILDAVLGHL